MFISVLKSHLWYYCMVLQECFETWTGYLILCFFYEAYVTLKGSSMLLIISVNHLKMLTYADSIQGFFQWSVIPFHEFSIEHPRLLLSQTEMMRHDASVCVKLLMICISILGIKFRVLEHSTSCKFSLSIALEGNASLVSLEHQPVMLFRPFRGCTFWKYSSNCSDKLKKLMSMQAAKKWQNIADVRSDTLFNDWTNAANICDAAGSFVLTTDII